jgi:TonB family protein
MLHEQSSISAPFAVETVPEGTVCRWDAPGSQRIIVNSSLVRDLVQAATHGFLALPKRGIEIGGVLFGKIRHEHGTIVYEIVAFEEIPCEHSYGPSFVLGERDRKGVAETVARREREGSASVVGLYRSYTARDAELDDADLTLLGAVFPRHKMVCLLLRPLTVKKCDASLQFWNSGAVESESPVVAPRMTEEPVAYEPPPEPRSTRRPGILAVLCCLLGGIACAATFEVWKVSHMPPEGHVRFDAQPAGGDLLLTWDTANPAVAASTRGTLAITDGAYPFQIQLNQQQVRRGKLNYSPTSGNASFELRLYDQGRKVAGDYLRVIRSANGAAEQASVPAPVLAPENPPAPVPAPPRGSPPVARREVEPEISPGIRARIGARTEVPIEVSVDSSGRVTNAWSKTAGHDGLEKYLIDAATKAARGWSFTPARSKNGNPVAAVTTIPFEFTPAH